MALLEAGVAHRRRNAFGTSWGLAQSSASWVWTFSRRKPLAGIGLVILVFLGVIAAFGPWIAPMDPLELHRRDLFHGPQWTSGYILGADHYGRDNLSRLIIGARTSLTIAFVAVFSGASIGLILGLYSGFYPDWRDSLISRIIDIKMAFPMLILALAIVAVLGQSKSNVMIAIAVIQIPSMTRVVRAEVMRIRGSEFVQAARAVGATDTRILWVHCAPQTFAPAMILVTSSLGTAIVVESSLSFLGLGTPPPQPSWGAMLSGPTLSNLERAPWNGVFPGLALSLTVFSINLLGDGLRDYLDPRLRS